MKIFTNHNNITCKNFNTDRLLRWRLILEECSPEIDYIPGKIYIVADALSRLTNNRNQQTTHESTYTTETISEPYNSNELIEVKLPLSLKVIDGYQQ